LIIGYLFLVRDIVLLQKEIAQMGRYVK